MDRGLNYFDGIIYINLAHRADRNEALLEELNRLEVAKEKIHRIDASHDLLNGHRGCALSHVKAIQYAIDQGFKNALILEDDFISSRLPQEIEKLIDHFTQSLKLNWDVFLIGGHVKDFEKTDYPKINRAIFSQCAHAYAVNKNYFQTLLSVFIHCYNQMGQDLFFLDSVPKAIDQAWNQLMIKDRWYFIEIFGQQRPSFSDIDLSWRDRNHQELFD